MNRILTLLILLTNISCVTQNRQTASEIPDEVRVLYKDLGIVFKFIKSSENKYHLEKAHFGRRDNLFGDDLKIEGGDLIADFSKGEIREDSESNKEIVRGRLVSSVNSTYLLSQPTYINISTVDKTICVGIVENDVCKNLSNYKFITELDAADLVRKHYGGKYQVTGVTTVNYISRVYYRVVIQSSPKSEENYYKVHLVDKITGEF